MTSTDVNRDGMTDLVVDLRRRHAACVPGAGQHDGAGEDAAELQRAHRVRGRQSAVSRRAADLNADGRPDLAAAIGNTDGAGGNTVNLNATPPALSVAPASLRSASSRWRRSARRRRHARHSTDATLPVRVSVSGDADDYLISRNDCADGVPQASCDVSVRFAPGVKGVRQATLNLDPAGPQIEHVTLSGDAAIRGAQGRGRGARDGARRSGRGTAGPDANVTPRCEA